MTSPCHTVDPEPGPEQGAKTISQCIKKRKTKLSLPFIPTDVFAYHGVPYMH